VVLILFLYVLKRCEALRVPLAGSRGPPAVLGGWGVVAFSWVVGCSGGLPSSFPFLGVLSCLLLLLSAVLFLLSLVSFGLGLPWCLASAGVRPLAPSLSGSPVRRLRWRVALVGRLRQLCRRWLPLSAPLVLLVRRCPSAFVRAGLPRGGSAPWLRLLRVLLRVSSRPAFLPCPCCLRVAGVALRLSSWRLGSPPLPSRLVGCRQALQWCEVVCVFP